LTKKVKKSRLCKCRERDEKLKLIDPI